MGTIASQTNAALVDGANWSKSGLRAAALETENRMTAAEAAAALETANRVAGDATNASAVTTEVTNRDAAILVETNRALASEAAIQALLNSSTGYFTGDGPPGLNVGGTQDGARYLDLTNGVAYIGKSGGFWNNGIPVNLATLKSAPNIVDFRFGNFAAYVTCTRTSPATNAIYTDNPGQAYAVFAATQPIFRSDFGVGSFARVTNFYLNSTAPVATQTITLAAGTFALWGNGTGTLTIAAGSAAGSGFGTISTLKGNFQKLVLTTGGTVVVTTTGSVNWVQLEGTDLNGYGRLGPTPLIVTAGAAATRTADVLTIVGAPLNALKGSAATFIMETVNINTAAAGASPPSARILMVNGLPIIYALDNLDVAYFASGGSYSAISTAGKDLTAVRARHGLAWSGTTMSQASGASPVKALALVFADAATVTTAYVGSDASGNQVTNGWIVRMEYYTTRLSDSALASAMVVQVPNITNLSNLPSVVNNWSPGVSLPKYRAARELTKAGIKNTIVGLLGDSTCIGTVTPISNSWPEQMAPLLAVQTGLAVGIDSWFGYSPSGGVPGTYNPKIVDSGTVASYGVGLGGGICNISASGYRAFTPGKQTDTYDVWLVMTSGYGTVNIRDGVGGTILQTLSTNAATAVQKLTATATLGNRAWVIEAASGNVHVVGAHAYNSAIKEIAIFQWSRSGFNAGNFVSAAFLENNVTYVIPTIKPDMMLVDLTINDAGAGTATATYQTNLATLSDSVSTNGGDILYQTGNPLNWGVGGYATLAAQLLILGAFKNTAFAKYNCPVIDIFTRWGGANGYANLQPSGYYADNAHPTAVGYADLATQPALVLAA